MARTTGPDFSVILVVPDHFEAIRHTVRCLRAQTVHDRIELILVGPTDAALRERDSPETEGFFDVRTVTVRPIENVDKAVLHGIRVATAPVVALLEDHAFPEPTWAEALLRAHLGPWSAVGAVALNANPDSLLSWVNFLVSYGSWSEPVAWGETGMVSGHNLTFKRAVLAEYGNDLERLLGREGGLLDELRAKGHRFYLEPQARYYHANPSLLSSTAELRFNSGRLYGAERAARGQWSLSRRLLYVAGGPLIPFVRFQRIRRELFAAGRHKRLVPRVFPALLLGLALDAAGQMVGYLTGAGRAENTMASFEVDRMRHLTERYRLRLANLTHPEPKQS